MLEAKPLVSIAMATYNGERFITEQLKSLVNQTYTNIEIVIVDDHSTDSTVPLIKDFQNRYSFIKLIQKEKNSGVTKTFEEAVRNCSGDYIALSDQDDIWEPNKIEVLLKALKEEDAAYSNSVLIDEKGNSLHKEFKSLMHLQAYYSGAPFLLSNCIPGHAILMKKNFVEKIIPFPSEVMFDRWISYCASANNGIQYVDLPLVKYRQHTGNVFGTRDSKTKRKKISSREKFQNKLNELRALAKAPVKNEETRRLTMEMLSFFHKKWSYKRSVFFFRNRKSILVIKEKSFFHKILFCFKMFFKPNY